MDGQGWLTVSSYGMAESRVVLQLLAHWQRAPCFIELFVDLHTEDFAAGEPALASQRWPYERWPGDATALVGEVSVDATQLYWKHGQVPLRGRLSQRRARILHGSRRRPWLLRLMAGVQRCCTLPGRSLVKRWPGSLVCIVRMEHALLDVCWSHWMRCLLWTLLLMARQPLAGRVQHDARVLRGSESMFVTALFTMRF